MRLCRSGDLVRVASRLFGRQHEIAGDRGLAVARGVCEMIAEKVSQGGPR
jgi:hypothetical protein